MIWDGTLLLVLAAAAISQGSWATRDCPAPRAPRHGIKVLFEDGQLVRYTCHPGYVLKGEHQAVCLGDRWSSSVPECLPIPGTPSRSEDHPLPLTHGRWPSGAPGSTEREIIVSPPDRRRVEDELRIASLRQAQEESVRRSRGQEVKGAGQSFSYTPIRRRTMEGYREENSRDMHYKATYRLPTGSSSSRRLGELDETSSKQQGSYSENSTSTHHRSAPAIKTLSGLATSGHRKISSGGSGATSYGHSRYSGSSNATRGDFKAFSKNKELYYNPGRESSRVVPAPSGQSSNYYPTYRITSQRPVIYSPASNPLSYHRGQGQPAYVNRPDQGRGHHETNPGEIRYRGQVKSTNRNNYPLSRPLIGKVKGGRVGYDFVSTESPRINVDVRVIPNDNMMTGRRERGRGGDSTYRAKQPSSIDSYSRSSRRPSPEPLSIAREDWVSEELERQEGESPLRQENEFNTSTEKTKELINESWLSRLSPELRHRFLAKIEEARRQRQGAEYRAAAPSYNYGESRENYNVVVQPTPRFIGNYRRQQSHEPNRFKNSRESIREDSQRYRKSSPLRTGITAKHSCDLNTQRAPYIPHGFVSQYTTEGDKLVALYRCVRRFTLENPAYNRLVCQDGIWTAPTPPKCLRRD